VVLAVAGCNQVFGLEVTKRNPDAPTIDTAFFDAPLDGPCTSATIDVQIDGNILGVQPGLAFTGSTLMNLSDSLQSHGLFRFDLSGLPPAPYSFLTLSVPYNTSDHDSSCGGGTPSVCGSCMGLEHDGYLDVFAMRSDWKELASGVEAGATWDCRYVGAPSGNTCPTSSWSSAGAVGGADRGVKVGTMHHLAGQDTQVVIKDMADVTPWISGTLLSLQVTPAPDTGVFIVRTHEQTCDPGTKPAQLTAWYCH
jgi:hypothetical protein